MAITITTSQIGRHVAAKVEQWLVDAPPADRLDQVLVAQSKRRIDNSGDSEIEYADLNPPRRLSGKPHFRQGGKPLIDTRRHVYDRLNGVMTQLRRALHFHLRGTLVAFYQHTGFSTSGPNFIPLTLHARRIHRKGVDPRLEGLVLGEDYIMAWGGVTVPARPIFRFAPEDIEEIISSIRLALQRGAAAEG